MKGHIRERSKGNWYAVLDITDPATKQRKRKWHKLGARGKKEAQTELAKLITQREQGVYIDPKKTTLGEYLDRWLTAIKPNISPRTFERYSEVVRVNINPMLGQVTLKNLTGLAISDAYARALESGRSDGSGGLSSVTVRYMHMLLKAALKQAVAWRLVHFNEAAAVKPPRAEKKQMTTYDMPRTAKVLEALQGQRIYIPALLAALCGLRRGEISALRWRHVDLEAGYLKIMEGVEQMNNGGVRIKETKSGRARTVALPTSVRDVLRTHKLKQAQDLLRLGIRVTDESFVACLADGSMMRPKYLTHEWLRAVRKADVPRICFHGLRHTHATLLLASGVHPKIASERLGHSNIAITLDLYSHVMPGMQEDAVAKVDAAFRTATKKPAV
jgi:integrase